MNHSAILKTPEARGKRPKAASWSTREVPSTHRSQIHPKDPRTRLGPIGKISEAIRHTMKKIGFYLVLGALSFSAGRALRETLPYKIKTIKAQDEVTYVEDFTDNEIHFPFYDPYIFTYLGNEYNQEGFWVVENEQIRTRDFNSDIDIKKSSGYNRAFSALGTINIDNGLQEFEFEAYRDAYNGGADSFGIVLGDPTEGDNGVYQKIYFNLHPEIMQRWGAYMQIVEKGPTYGFLYEGYYIPKTIIPEDATRVRIGMKKDENNLLRLTINGEMIYELYHFRSNPTGPIFELTELPYLYMWHGREGMIGVFMYDSQTDPYHYANTYFDNIKLTYKEAGMTYNTPDGSPPGSGSSLSSQRGKGASSLGGKGSGNLQNPYEINSPIYNVFTRGDSNNDLSVDISDAINTLAFLYLGTRDLRCPDSADVNDDGIVDISDPIYTLNALFLDKTLTIPPPNIKLINPDKPPTLENILMDAALGMDTTNDRLPPCYSGINVKPGVGLVEY